MHYLIGHVGHLTVIAAFVTSIISSFAYWKSTFVAVPSGENDWLKNGRFFYYFHVLSVLGVVACLFFIIYNHYFEYHYVYSHSSLTLPNQYMLSCFWEGQEGSFLLWLFWQALIGIILLKTQKKWEGSVMTIFAIVQVFLTSMILGIVIPGIDLKLGSSPFILLRDALDDPIFKIQPDFIPKDGNGLNALLQNYWMVIHPPTLFLGFALALPPFAFCVAGLWKKKYTDWITQSLPWLTLCGGVLGLGILMGGYWAYETLNFGGYWNWDPVENAVYVPWLVLIAAIHTTVIYHRNGRFLKGSIILVLSIFILLLYSTFLTRSGILGDSSVHSFTDLGLSGQLLIYLLFFTLGAFVLVVIRWKDIPTIEKDIAVYSPEFWIFLGSLTLCLMGFQVLLPTSIPVYNKVISLLGINSSLAPPADQIHYYSKFQLWFAVCVALLSGTGQFFWWKKLDKEKLKPEILPTVLISLLIFSIVILIAKIYYIPYIVLTLSGIYLIVSNLKVLSNIWKTNPQISGGAIAHIGVGLMLIGVLFSAGYSKVVSLNNTGMLILKDAPTEFNHENLLLFINEPRTMAGYSIEYRGERVEPRHKSGYINKNDVIPTPIRTKVVATKDIVFQDKKLYNAKDTIEIYPENTFYEIELRKEGALAAILFPRVQINPTMGGFIASPDIKRSLTNDLYTHVSLPMNKDEEPEWEKMKELKIKPNEEFFINSKYSATLQSIKSIHEIEGIRLTADDVAVQATIQVQGEHETYFAQPIFLIKNKTHVGRLPAEINDLGVKITLLNIFPDTNQFLLGLSSRQKDWVVIKALEKPYINVLWLGTGVLMIGFALTSIRKFKTVKK